MTAVLTPAPPLPPAPPGWSIDGTPAVPETTEDAPSIPERWQLCLAALEARDDDAADAAASAILARRPKHAKALHARAVLRLRSSFASREDEDEGDGAPPRDSADALGAACDAVTWAFTAASLRPSDAWFRHTLGAALLRTAELGAADDAAAAARARAAAAKQLEAALSLAPASRHVHARCGAMLRRVGGRDAAALAALERALALPLADGGAADGDAARRRSTALVHYLAARLRKGARELPAAAAHLRAALRELEPVTSRDAACAADADAYRFWLAACEAGGADTTDGAAAGAAGPPPAAAPEAYVRSLYQKYAETFDDHLVGKLAYRTPQLLAEFVAEIGGDDDGRARWRRAADLGCGTGLAAVALGGFVGAIDGVDLSPAMVAKARERGVYDRLLAAENLAIFRDPTDGDGGDGGARRGYGLVVAADVFPYVGCLRATFVAARDAMAIAARDAAADDAPLFVFSTEELDEPAGKSAAPFVLRSTGRFTHAPAALQSLASEVGLRTVRQRTGVALRKQAGRDVLGTLTALALA